MPDRASRQSRELHYLTSIYNKLTAKLPEPSRITLEKRILDIDRRREAYKKKRANYKKTNKQAESAPQDQTNPFPPPKEGEPNTSPVQSENPPPVSDSDLPF